MLSYVAHIPHSPLLLKQISKDKHKDYKKSVDAINTIAQDLYSQNIEAIITITPHGIGLDEAFVINFSPQYECDFRSFINYDTYPQFFGDSLIASEIRRKLCTSYPISSITSNFLDTASSAAIMQLQTEKKKLPIVPITHSLHPPKKLYSFGSSVRDILENTKKRIAVIGLGNLSHNNFETEKQGKIFDTKLIDQLHDKDTDALLSYKDHQINSFSVCAFRPLAILLGILDKMNYNTDVLNYEQKHGVGLMTSRFVF